MKRVLYVTLLLGCITLFGQRQGGGLSLGGGSLQKTTTENQSFSPYIEHYGTIVPPTPNAANFQVYGDIPVDYATGVPNISIPIYTVEEDGVTIPISLSYHASGIKVDDIASPVGLKWTLNTGGGIFRTVRGGKPDEQGWLTTNRSYIEDSWYTNNFDKNSWVSQQAFEGLNRDHMPDSFNFSFLGNSGNFIFKAKQAPSLLFERQVQTDISPIYTVNGAGFYTISSFEASDYMGNTFTFSDQELNINDTELQSNLGAVLASPSTYFRQGVTAWMLSDIQTRNNKQINLSYEDYHLQYRIDKVSQSFMVYPRAAPGSLGGRARCNGRLSGSDIERFTTNLLHDTHNKLISVIETENVRVNFNYSINNNASAWKKQLDKITITDKITGKDKSFHFVYGVYGGDPRLKLVELYEVGYDGTRKPSYKFDYTAGQLPQKGSFAKDYWGYYNGKSNTYLVPKVDLASSKIPNFYNNLANRNRDFNYTKYGVLNKIEYPTGGSTEFVYEPLSFLADNAVNTKGGLRVKEIQNRNEGNEINRKEYIYFGLQAKNYENGHHIYTSGSGDDITYTFSSEYAVAHPLLQRDGHYFEKVEVRTLYDNSPQYLKQEYFYEPYNTTNKISFLQRKEQMFRNNDIVSKVEYINNIQSKGKYEWNELPLKEHCYLEIGPIPTNGDPPDSWVGNHLGYDDIPVRNHFNYYKNTLKEKFTTQYEQTANGLKPVTVVNRYTYNDDLLVTKEFTDTRYLEFTYEEPIRPQTDPNGEYFSIETTYPKDYTDASLQGLVTKNMLSLPISKVVKNIKGKIGTQIQGEFFVYDTNGNPTKSYRYNKGLGSNSGTDSHVPLNYDLHASFSNIQGKPTQIQRKDGTVVSYLWDTTRMYVLAKVENASYSTAISKVQGSLDMSLADTTLRTRLHRIRTLLPNALVTTYTYDPLVGVTSVTDPRGETLFYEYDDLSRLKLVKNADGHILKEHKYNYKN